MTLPPYICKCENCGIEFESTAIITLSGYHGGDSWSSAASPCCHADYEELDKAPSEATAAITLFLLRKSREAHPEGAFNPGGCWYPSDFEATTGCMSIRSPSAAYPYSLLTHCRTRKHIKELIHLRGLDAVRTRFLEA